MQNRLSYILGIVILGVAAIAARAEEPQQQSDGTASKQIATTALGEPKLVALNDENVAGMDLQVAAQFNLLSVNAKKGTAAFTRYDAVSNTRYTATVKIEPNGFAITKEGLKVFVYRTPADGVVKEVQKREGNDVTLTPLPAESMIVAGITSHASADAPTMIRYAAATNAPPGNAETK